MRGTSQGDADGEERLLMLAAALQGAVDRGEIEAFYQPQIDLRSGRMVAFEALSRWNHSQLGSISPTEFIPIAESNGLIHEIGDYMLDHGCECAAEWQGRGTPIEIAVNVSAKQLAADQFYVRVVEILQRRSLDPQTLTLEITESQLIVDIVDAAERLERLRALGVGVSIDDFGTGFSSIEQLLALPANELKIDRSLIQEENTASQNLISGIVDLVRARGVRVVAEGVETQSQLDRARSLNCDRAQGFLFAKPAPKSELRMLLPF